MPDAQEHRRLEFGTKLSLTWRECAKGLLLTCNDFAGCQPCTFSNALLFVPIAFKAAEATSLGMSLVYQHRSVFSKKACLRGLLQPAGLARCTSAKAALREITRWKI